MRPDVEAIVDRLSRTRSRPWLEVLDAAALDEPATQAPSAADMVRPYQWLLERVREGVRLTEAGYLPPALVAAAMDELGWSGDWPGKHNREHQMIPVLELRESAQRFGLLRKQYGRLLLTRVGARMAGDPAGLWWHLASRLPDARSEPERHAGILYLLIVAADRSLDDALLADGMTLLGWAQGPTRQSLSPTAAFAAARDTWAVFRRLDLLGVHPWITRAAQAKPQARAFARAALLGRPDGRAPAVPLRAEPGQPSRRAPEQAVQLLVTLCDVEPPIWRRLIVPASLTLRELHAAVQTAMGWQDYHLHLFEIGDLLYGDVEEIDERHFGDEETFTVGQAAAVAPAFQYEYDFGDGWRHEIRVEQVMPSLAAGAPHLLGAARACPPEDCGGMWGYEHLLEVLADPAHEEHEEMLDWVGGPFDPEAVDIAAINANLELYDRHTRQRRLRGK